MNKDKKDFPLEALFEWVKNKGNRFVDISEKTFCDYRWFALKIVMPDIRYIKSRTFTVDIQMFADYISENWVNISL